MNEVYYKTITTPIGKLIIAAATQGVFWIGGQSRFNRAIIWIQKIINTPNIQEDKNYSLLIEAERQINDYFNGRLKEFTVPLHLQGTEFQKKVWMSIAKIPYGQTLSYKSLALSVDNPKAVRVIGTICGLNPLILLIPCHRVVGSNGKLTGFVEGLETKEFLLNLEKPSFQAKLF